MNRRDFVRTAAVSTGGVLLAQTAWPMGSAPKGEPAPSYSYAKPQFKNGATILFQGDSITHGGRGSDLNHYMGHGYAYLIAARLGADMCAQDLRFLNRGVSGDGVGDLLARWQRDTIELKPDVVSILVGVNDVGPKTPLEQYQEQYSRLLKETKEALPSVRLALCDPFILPVGGIKDVWEERSGKAARFREIVKNLAQTFGAVHIRTQDVFDAACKLAPAIYWLWDGVHPTPAGHELLSRRWLETMAGEYPR